MEDLCFLGVGTGLLRFRTEVQHQVLFNFEGPDQDSADVLL